ncbi:FHA domain-containing protein [Microterricola viridarii]|uniref:FHA domain-containing protein n=1 Tax=Microterricola viridarii TaxID=412690 RepID=A0A1H1RPK8_9MICO|nr:FHA domain-containing protein [Microterricola viridarii]SDS37532.1 hypothetical protein SAMN04489834_1368 [Microterricola viridarii]
MSSPRWRAVPDVPGVDPSTLWNYVIAQSWVAAVPGSTPEPVLDALLGLRGAAEGTLERVLAVIPLQGENAVEDFAIVELAADIDGTAGDGAEGTVSVIVRGSAAVDVFGSGGPRRLTSRGIRPWLLADFREVKALSFSVENARPITAAELPPRGATASVDGDGQWAEQGGAQQGSALHGRRLDLVLGVPGDAEEGPAGGEAAAPRMRIAGEIFVLDVDSYIGRRPRATALGQDTARLITVVSPAQEVSATHILLGPRGEDVVVTDLHSTNGTLVELPDGAQLHLQAGVATVVVPGSRILLGDGVVVELLPHSADGAARWR